MDELSETPDKALEEAFRQTTYEVFSPAFTLRIGRQHPALDAWLTKYGFETWAFVSAVNPGALAHTETYNSERHAAFSKTLQASQKTYFEGRGLPDQVGWQPEPGFFLPGISREEALQLARHWAQLALVFGQTSAEAELLWT